MFRSGPGRSATETYRLIEADDTEWREQFRLLGWGEILDDVLVYAHLDDADLVFLAQCWRATGAAAKGWPPLPHTVARAPAGLGHGAVPGAV